MHIQFDLDTLTAMKEGEGGGGEGGGEGGDKTVLKLQKKINTGRIFARIRSAVLPGGGGEGSCMFCLQVFPQVGCATTSIHERLPT